MSSTKFRVDYSSSQAALLVLVVHFVGEFFSLNGRGPVFLYFFVFFL